MKKQSFVCCVRIMCGDKRGAILMYFMKLFLLNGYMHIFCVEIILYYIIIVRYYLYDDNMIIYY